MPPKQTSPESSRAQTLTRIKMRLEGYIGVGSQGFLEEFERLLIEHGLRPEELVFSGFNGEEVARGKKPHHMMIFCMNETGWRNAVRLGEPTPADYAAGFARPVIGLYDKHQLSNVYSGSLTLEHGGDVDSRVEFEDIVKGSPLSDLGPDEAVEETVVHNNYPHQRATDALLGLVFLHD